MKAGRDQPDGTAQQKDAQAVGPAAGRDADQKVGRDDDRPVDAVGLAKGDCQFFCVNKSFRLIDSLTVF